MRRGELTFVINHSMASVVVALQGMDVATGAAVTEVSLEPQGVAILTT